MTTTQNPVEAPVVPTSKPIRCGLFAGMLKNFQLGGYNTMIACGMSHRLSHKVALDYGSDLGRAMAIDAEFASKVSKANKDGESKLSGKFIAKLRTERSMSIMRICQTLHSLYEEDLLGSKDLPVLSTNLQEYLELCTAWVKSQNWEEKKTA